MTSVTDRVLELVREERTRQEARYGEVNTRLVSGTGPEVRWLSSFTGQPATQVQKVLRADYERFEEEQGLPTWMHLVREEVAEAFQEEDPELLSQELVQVAALCVSWVERLRSFLCEDCGNVEGPHMLDGRRLCMDCLQAAYHPEMAR